MSLSFTLRVERARVENMGGSRKQTWTFCLRSLGKEYGLGFIRQVVLPHPLLTLRGLKKYKQGTCEGEVKASVQRQPVALEHTQRGPTPVLGLGFCLKPLEPECLSGRFNHDCYYFEKNLNLRDGKPPLCCRDCDIRSLGEAALKSGFSLYIMTSARDILHGLLLPALREKRFSFALLGLCAYSMEPFKMALSVVGLEALIFPFKSGDCRDYRSWLQADTGVKEEQTDFEDGDIKRIQDILAENIILEKRPNSILKYGQVFYPKV